MFEQNTKLKHANAALSLYETEQERAKRQYIEAQLLALGAFRLKQSQALARREKIQYDVGLKSLFFKVSQIT